MNKSEKREVFRKIVPITGFYPVEMDEFGPFIWSRRKFNVRKPEGIRYLDLFLCYYGLNGKLFISQATAENTVEIRLTRGWSRYVADLCSLQQSDLEFEVIPPIAAPGDPRELGVMIRDFSTFHDAGIYERERKRMANKRENMQEFFSGRSRLDSTPTRLRIDVETSCNMSPRCSYCEWEWMKNLEKHSSLGKPLTVLKGLGRFFDCAEEIVDCGYGEPLLNPDLEAIITTVTEIGAHFEMTSNGHLLDRKNRDKLLGHDITLYISLDAATETGYRRLRQGTVDRVIENIRALCEEKQHYSNLPTTVVSFISMQSNVAEFEPFLNRMIDIGVDAVKIRSLYQKPELPLDVTELGSCGFNYQSEILPLVDQIKFLEFAEAYAANKGLKLISELDFCRELDDTEGPICNEPWQTLYILKRGLLPCCFSRTPLSPWERRGNKPLIEFVSEVWNGDLMREIREALAAGRFHETCENSTGCAIMKRKSLTL